MTDRLEKVGSLAVGLAGLAFKSAKRATSKVAQQIATELAEPGSTTDWELLANSLAEAEKEYRRCYEVLGGDNIKTGRAWDLMRRYGDQVRAATIRQNAKKN